MKNNIFKSNTGTRRTHSITGTASTTGTVGIPGTAGTASTSQYCWFYRCCWNLWYVPVQLILLVPPLV